MFKLEIENIGSGFQTLGRGAASSSPQIGLTRQSKIEISAEQFFDYEFDIRYFHTKHSGEIKVRLLVDGEVSSPDDVASLCRAGDIDVPVVDAGSLTPVVPDVSQEFADNINAPTSPMTITYGGAAGV